jgi:hypothetical protein
MVQEALLTNLTQRTCYATVLVAEFKIILKPCKVVYLYSCKTYSITQEGNLKEKKHKLLYWHMFPDWNESQSKNGELFYLTLDSIVWNSPHVVYLTIMCNPAHCISFF